MNNYDISSTGYNVDVQVYCDNSQTQDIFDMSFIHLQGDTYQFHPEWCDSDGQGRFADFEDMYKIAKTLKNKKSMLKYLINCRYTDFRGWNFEDTIQSFMNEFVYPKDLRDFVETLNDYDIEHTLNFERYVSRGYSQGDATEIFINKINIYNDMKKDIDHILWDAPLRARATINGIDYYAECDGSYEWDRENFIADITKQYGIPIVEAILRELTPLNPEYL